jgi:GH24 family phage-related lysozyme (muramidase)
MPASQAALPLVDFDVAIEVASHEALIRQTYKDSVGVLTWCVGMTNATGHSVERYISKPASVEHCMRLFAWALRNYAVGVYRAFEGHTLTKAQFAAALSFHWNTGAIETASWVKHWKAGRIDQSKEAFMHWNKPREITGRREKERDLFFDGKWSNNGTMTEYTRLTKKMTPVWSSAKKLDVSKELRAAFAGTPAVIIDQAPQPNAPVTTPTLSPNHSPQALLVIAVIGAVAAAGTWVWTKIKGKLK